MYLAGIQPVSCAHDGDKAAFIACEVFQKPDLGAEAINGINHIISRKAELFAIALIEENTVALKLCLFIDSGDALLHERDLIHADGVQRRQELTIEITGADGVEIYEDKVSDPCPSQRFSGIGAHSPQACDANLCLFDLIQSLCPDEQLRAAKVCHNLTPVSFS